MTQAGVISPASMKYIVEKMLSVYQFGPTQELLDSLDTQGAAAAVDDQTLKKIQVALLQALKDAGEVGPEAQQQRIMENKVGVLQALKDSGLAKNMTQPVPDNPELAPIPYKDAPEDIKRQMEANAGLTPSQGISPVGSDQIVKHQQAENQATKMEQDQQNAESEQVMAAQQQAQDQANQEAQMAQEAAPPQEGQNATEGQ